MDQQTDNGTKNTLFSQKELCPPSQTATISGYPAAAGPQERGGRVRYLWHVWQAACLTDHQDSERVHARGRVWGEGQPRLCQEDQDQAPGILFTTFKVLLISREKGMWFWLTILNENFPTTLFPYFSHFLPNSLLLHKNKFRPTQRQQKYLLFGDFKWI